MSIGSKLISGSLLRTGNFIAQALIAFLLTPFIIHSLGDRLYGFWTLVGTFIGYYGLLDLGLSSAVQRHIAESIGLKDDEKLNTVFNTTLKMFIIGGFIALAITIVLAGCSHLIWNNPEDASLFRSVILVLGVHTAISFPIRTFLGTLDAMLCFNIIAMMQLFTLIVRTSLIYTVLVSGYGVLAMALVSLLAGLPQNILYIIFTRKKVPNLRIALRGWHRQIVRKLFSYSLVSFIGRVADQLRFHADVFVITAFMNLAVVTHYRIAAIMVQYFYTFIGVSMGVITPVFSQQDGARDEEALRKTFFFSTKVSICISIFIGFSYIMLGNEFIERWMGTSYLDAYPVLLILTVGYITALSQAPAVALMYGTSKHKLFAYVNVIEGLCNLALSLVLVRKYGLIGVALGTTIPMVIIKLVIQPIYFSRVTSIGYREYFKRVTKTTTNALLSLVIPAVMIFQFEAADYQKLVILSLFSISIYAVSIWFVEFSSEERHMLQRSFFPKVLARGANL